MKKRFLSIAFIISTIFIITAAYSADPEPIYGSQLMTERERIEHRNRMRNASNAEEREQIRKEHHERMRIRAEKRGIKLPDEPPKRGYKGMGPGKGQGKGMGPYDDKAKGMGKGKR